MNAGAAVAKGDLLCFLHADTQPPHDLVSVERHGACVVGCVVCVQQISAAAACAMAWCVQCMVGAQHVAMRAKGQLVDAYCSCQQSLGYHHGWAAQPAQRPTSGMRAQVTANLLTFAGGCDAPRAQRPPNCFRGLCALHRRYGPAHRSMRHPLHSISKLQQHMQNLGFKKSG